MKTKKTKSERTALLNVRMTPNEYQALEEVVQHEGQSISDWIRQTVRHAHRRLERERVSFGRFLRGRPG